MPFLDDLFEAVATMSSQTGKKGRGSFRSVSGDQGLGCKGPDRAPDEDSLSNAPDRSPISSWEASATSCKSSSGIKIAPFIDSGKHFPLGKIPKDEFAEFVQTRFEETGYQTDLDAIREILHVADDHPYYTQLFCHILWDCKRQEKVIAKEDITWRFREVFMREAHAFHDIWDMLPLKSGQ